MKNVQVIDGAVNCVYDIFAATEEEFAYIFPNGQDIAFIDEVYRHGNTEHLDRTFERMWQRRVPRAQASGLRPLASAARVKP